MDIYGYSVETFFSFVEGLLLIFWINTVFEKNCLSNLNRIKVLLFSLLYAVASFMFTEFVPRGLHTLIIYFYAVLLICFTFKLRILSSVFTMASFSLFIFITEAPVILAYMALFQNDMTHIGKSSGLAFHVLASLSKLLQFVLLLLIRRFSKLKFSYGKYRTKEETELSLFAFQLFIFLAFVYCANNSDKNTLLFNILTYAFCLIYFLMGILDIKERIRAGVVQNKYQMQEQQLNNMEQMLNIIRKEKHDFINHLNTIQLISTLNEPDSLQQINRYITGVSDTIKASYKCFGTQNTYIDALLAIKSSYASELGISFRVAAHSTLDLIDFSDNEMVSILSNLIDNAIEAVRQGGVKEDSFVIFKSYAKDERLFLEVADNGIAISDEIKGSIFNQGFTTKDNKPDSGYGLYIVKQLVAKNKGSVFVESDRDITRFIVDFAVNKQKVIA